MRGKLTYANVVATLCLFLILGTGAAFGAKKLINGAKIKPHTITGKQVKNGSLTSAAFAGGIPAGSAGPAGATGPTGPAGTPASLLDEDVHLIQPAGVCATTPGIFCSGAAPWGNYANGYASVGYFKDNGGVVHLQGVAKRTGPGELNPIFYLPPGYRPTDATHEFGVNVCSNTFGSVDISTDGKVAIPSTVACVVLDGVSFRAG